MRYAVQTKVADHGTTSEQWFNEYIRGQMEKTTSSLKLARELFRECMIGDPSKPVRLVSLTRDGNVFEVLEFSKGKPR